MKKQRPTRVLNSNRILHFSSSRRETAVGCSSQLAVLGTRVSPLSQLSRTVMEKARRSSFCRSAPLSASAAVGDRRFSSAQWLRFANKPCAVFCHHLPVFPGT